MTTTRISWAVSFIASQNTNRGESWYEKLLNSSPGVPVTSLDSQWKQFATRIQGLSSLVCQENSFPQEEVVQKDDLSLTDVIEILIDFHLAEELPLDASDETFVMELRVLLQLINLLRLCMIQIHDNSQFTTPWRKAEATKCRTALLIVGQMLHRFLSTRLQIDALTFSFTSLSIPSTQEDSSTSNESNSAVHASQLIGDTFAAWLTLCACWWTEPFSVLNTLQITPIERLHAADLNLTVPYLLSDSAASLLGDRIVSDGNGISRQLMKGNILPPFLTQERRCRGVRDLLSASLISGLNDSAMKFAENCAPEVEPSQNVDIPMPRFLVDAHLEMLILFRCWLEYSFEMDRKSQLQEAHEEGDTQSSTPTTLREYWEKIRSYAFISTGKSWNRIGDSFSNDLLTANLALISLAPRTLSLVVVQGKGVTSSVWTADNSLQPISGVTMTDASVLSLLPGCIRLIERCEEPAQLLGLYTLRSVCLRSSTGVLLGITEWILPRLLKSFSSQRNLVRIVGARLLQTLCATTRHSDVIVQSQHLFLIQSCEELLRSNDHSSTWVELLALQPALDCAPPALLSAHLNNLVGAFLHCGNSWHAPVQRLSLRLIKYLYYRCPSDMTALAGRVLPELFRIFLFYTRSILPDVSRGTPEDIASLIEEVTEVVLTTTYYHKELTENWLTSMSTFVPIDANDSDSDTAAAEAAHLSAKSIRETASNLLARLEQSRLTPLCALW